MRNVKEKPLTFLDNAALFHIISLREVDYRNYYLNPYNLPSYHLTKFVNNLWKT